MHWQFDFVSGKKDNLIASEQAFNEDKKWAKSLFCFTSFLTNLPPVKCVQGKKPTKRTKLTEVKFLLILC